MDSRRTLTAASRSSSAPHPRQQCEEKGVAARTRRLLLDCAIETINTQGRIPSISELAVAAGVSRATAYRYFPTRSRLIASVVDFSLAPVRSWQPDASEGAQRLMQLFESTFALFTRYEPQMRAALQLSLEHAALEKAGRLEEEPYRRGYRIGILEHALEPLRPQLSRRSHELLWKSMSLVYGIETYVILKDIWGANDREVESVARWMLDALVRHALSDSPAARRAGA